MSAKYAIHIILQEEFYMYVQAYPYTILPPWNCIYMYMYVYTTLKSHMPPTPFLALENLLDISFFDWMPKTSPEITYMAL